MKGKKETKEVILFKSPKIIKNLNKIVQNFLKH